MRLAFGRELRPFRCILGSQVPLVSHGRSTLFKQSISNTNTERANNLSRSMPSSLHTSQSFHNRNNYSTMSQSQNETAKAFKALHKPGEPLILTNVWDAITATAVAQSTSTKALATASAAMAAAVGLDDDQLTLPINLSATRAIGMVAKKHNLPLTIDFQDGYGDQLEEGVREVIRAGAVGINLEDYGRELNDLYPIDVAVQRIERVMNVAKDEGVPEFVVNARTDALLYGRSLSEAIVRGKKYLEAGASNVFVWGGKKRGGITRDEVVELTKAFDGKLNVSLRVIAEGLGVSELKKIGVARLSIGPQLSTKVVSFLQGETDRILADY